MSGRDVLSRGASGALFRNRTMDFLAGWILGYAPLGGPSAGALLRCYAAIRDGSPDSWVDAFSHLAEATERRARDAAVSGRDAEAGAAWLEACVAHRASLAMLPPSGSAASRTTRAMEDAFAQFLRRAGEPVCRWSVPFAGRSLPGYASPGLAEAKRLVLIVGGGDTHAEDLWFFGGRALTDAGWAVAMVDLPGQGGTPASGLHFGVQTHQALLATIDALRADGFAGDLVLLGWSGGGIFVTGYAAAARPQDRLAAIVASTPVYDAAALFREAMPAILRRPETAVARALVSVARRNAVLSRALDKYDWQFGPGGIAALLREVERFGRADVGAIDVPVLGLLGAGEDQELHRQARHVVGEARRRHAASEIIVFDAATGADAHCQVGNLPLAMSRVIAWLERVVPDAGR